MNNEFGSKKARGLRLVKIGGIGIALLLLLALATTGFADDVVVGTLDVSAGTLTMPSAEAPVFPGVTLSGVSQTTTDAIAIDVIDLTGSGDGWDLDITSTEFTDADSNTLATSALKITGVTVGCDIVDCTLPSNSIGYPFTVEAGTVAPTATTFFNAAAASGLGDFTITPTFELTIPSTTYAGTYTSTVTLTIIAGLP